MKRTFAVTGYSFAEKRLCYDEADPFGQLAEGLDAKREKEPRQKAKTLADAMRQMGQELVRPASESVRGLEANLVKFIRFGEERVEAQLKQLKDSLANIIMNYEEYFERGYFVYDPGARIAGPELAMLGEINAITSFDHLVDLLRSAGYAVTPEAVAHAKGRDEVEPEARRVVVPESGREVIALDHLSGKIGRAFRENRVHPYIRDVILGQIAQHGTDRWVAVPNTGREYFLTDDGDKLYRREPRPEVDTGLMGYTYYKLNRDMDDFRLAYERGSGGSRLTLPASIATTEKRSVPGLQEAASELKRQLGNMRAVRFHTFHDWILLDHKRADTDFARIQPMITPDSEIRFTVLARDGEQDQMERGLTIAEAVHRVQVIEARSRPEHNFLSFKGRLFDYVKTGQVATRYNHWMRQVLAKGLDQWVDVNDNASGWRIYIPSDGATMYARSTPRFNFRSGFEEYRYYQFVPSKSGGDFVGINDIAQVPAFAHKNFVYRHSDEYKRYTNHRSVLSMISKNARKHDYTEQWGYTVAGAMMKTFYKSGKAIATLRGELVNGAIHYHFAGMDRRVTSRGYMVGGEAVKYLESQLT